MATGGIQIQHLLKLNVRPNFFAGKQNYNSNTTLVKVKFCRIFLAVSFNQFKYNTC